jgi:hypothetical protein
VAVEIEVLKPPATEPGNTTGGDRARCTIRVPRGYALPLNIAGSSFTTTNIRGGAERRRAATRIADLARIDRICAAESKACIADDAPLALTLVGPFVAALADAAISIPSGDTLATLAAVAHRTESTVIAGRTVGGHTLLTSAGSVA